MDTQWERLIPLMEISPLEAEKLLGRMGIFFKVTEDIANQLGY